MQRAHETFHRQGHFFCRRESSFPAHRPTHVQKQNRGGPGGVLGVVDGKVPGTNFDGHASVVEQSVFERLNHVDMERITLDIGPAVLDLYFLAASITSRMLAHAIPAQLLVYISQSQLPHAPDTARS